MSPIAVITFSVVSLLLRTVQTIQVETKYGTVEGETLFLEDDYHRGVAVDTFMSIPFAKPPTGDLRFTPPQEPDPWDGVLDVKNLTSICIQDLLSVMWLTHPFWTDIDEDCLTLSIYAPANRSSAPYPVMVWMYGGAYQAGANIQYPGHFLASRDLVIVVPNYRLGIFGFAYSGDEHAPGNMGLMDQQLTLQFVQENIANFGGDPGRVTIFGQSAGAGSVGMHLMSPYSTDLFHQAVLHSGSELAGWAYNGPSQEPENYLVQVAMQLDCPTDDTEAMVDCLRTKSTFELRTTDFNCSEGSLCLGFAPVIDGDFVPDLPLVLRENDQFNHVPEMIGITQEDAFLYLIALGAIVGPEVIERGPNRTEFQEILRGFVSVFESVIIGGEDRVEDVYQALDFYYTPWPHIDDGDLNRYQIGALMTDIAYGVTADMQIKDHTEGVSTYFYVYDFISDNATMIPEWMGTPHMLDVPYVWGFPFLRYNPAVREQIEINDIIGWTEEDDDYAYYMETLWSNYGKYGNPTPEPVQPPNNLPYSLWPEFSNEELNYMYIGREACESRLDYRQHQYAFWTEYMTYLALGDAVPEISDHEDNTCFYDKCEMTMTFDETVSNQVHRIHEYLKIWVKKSL